jgi:hypothetical protein
MPVNYYAALKMALAHCHGSYGYESERRAAYRVSMAIGSLGRLQMILDRPGIYGPVDIHAQDKPSRNTAYTGRNAGGREVWQQREGQALEVRNEAGTGWGAAMTSANYTMHSGEFAVWWPEDGRIVATLPQTAERRPDAWPVAEAIPPGSLVCLNPAGELVPFEPDEVPGDVVRRCSGCGHWCGDVDRPNEYAKCMLQREGKTHGTLWGHGCNAWTARQPDPTPRPETDDELRERVLGGHLDNNGAGSLLACSFADTSFSDRGRELPPINEATGADLDRYAQLAGLARHNTPDLEWCQGCVFYSGYGRCAPEGRETIPCNVAACRYRKPGS